MSDDPLLETHPLGVQWPTLNPFLFCVHHLDAYPRGTAELGPAVSLEGRALGSDFSRKDGFSMYHGRVVPGFPQHPHRGFETVTIVREGLIDHSDSLGATARFGAGDVQWLTAGKGIVHSEMFPLLSGDVANPLELFQIWLNLPAADKLVEPHFSMLWAERIPRHRVVNSNGAVAEVVVVAGALGEVAPPPPPPKSWASRADSDLAIWTLTLEAGATYTLPASARSGGDIETLRTLYFFQGNRLRVGEHRLEEHAAVRVRSDRPLTLQAEDGTCELLMLQGKPIDEPVAHYGPFVMNTREELETAMRDYQRTRFGGWPFADDGPVHGATRRRFARRGDREESPT